MSEEQTLIERLEKATGPDANLDAELMAVFYRREQRHIGCMEQQNDGSWAPYKDDVWVNPTTDKWVSTGALSFTSSLDAAMTLVPEGWSWSVTHESENKPPRNHCGHVRRFWTSFDKDHFAFAAHPAIALCIAALKARATP